MSTENETTISELLKTLNKQLDDLRRELDAIRLLLPIPENVLAQRGYRVLASNPHQFLLLPVPPSQENLDDYYRLMRRYSFRLFLRDLIRYRNDLRLEKLIHYCSPSKAQRYLRILCRLGVLASAGGDSFEYVGNPQVNSFGDTLEWFVSETLRREFRIPSSWGLSMHGLKKGGDYDVVGVLGTNLVYVETKASPPKNLHMDVVEGFIRRVRDLQPELAILLVDTHLRMEDKINKMVHAAFREQHPKNHPLQTAQLSRGVFQMGPGLYTCNSKPAIHKNLRVCIRDFLGLTRERRNTDSR